MAHEPHTDDEATFGLDVERGSARTVVTMYGVLDHSVVPLLHGVLRDDPAEGRDIVFDIGDVGFVDGAGMGALGTVAARARAAGGRAAVVSPSTMAEKVIRLLDLAEVVGLPLEPGGDGGGCAPGGGDATKTDGARAGAVEAGRPEGSPVRARRWEPGPRRYQRPAVPRRSR